MLDLIVEAQTGRRQHRNALEKLVKKGRGTVRIASAYVTDTKLLAAIDNRNVRLLTHLSAMDIVTGATSLDSLGVLIKAGVQCRYFSDGPRLHAKVYIFGKQSAVVTSANLTRKALDKNIEVGIRLPKITVYELIEWFDKLWDVADDLDSATISQWKKQTAGQRKKYSKLREKVEKQVKVPSESLSAESTKRLSDLFNTADGFFVCNTNRRYSREAERRMHDGRYAAAWETFKYPNHMKQVKRRDAIFMLAKGAGFIGIGRARGRARILRRSSPREWRIPVEWLAWKKDDDALWWPSHNATFFDVSDDKYEDLRERVRNHFLTPA